MANVYFDLTEAFNAEGPTVALASGQAVVFYRVAIMSKDGDWVVRESPEACARVLAVLESPVLDTACLRRLTCGGCRVEGRAISSSSTSAVGAHGATS